VDDMPGRRTVRRAQTIFTEEEFKALQAWLKKKGIRMYTLLKVAALEYIRRNP
jgi:hypothetical protein